MQLPSILRSNPRTPGAPLVRNRLVVLILLLSSAHALMIGNVRAEARYSLTLSSLDCSHELALDGSPISTSDCSGETDRSFVLSGPDGQQVDLTTTRQPAPDGVNEEMAFWSADPDDGVADSGTWSLKANNPNPDVASLVSCLKIVGAKSAPAALDFSDGGVHFEWDAAVPLGSNTTAGEYLNCTWYSMPPLPQDIRPGLLTVRVATGSGSTDADFVVAEPDGTPQFFTNIRPGAVAATTFRLANADTAEQVTLSSDASSGPWASTTFALPAGDYTLTADATSHSAPITVEEGQTVLALTTLPGSSDAVPSVSPTAEASTPTPLPTRPAQPTATATVPPTNTPLPTIPPTSTPTTVVLPTVPPIQQVPTETDGQVFQFSSHDWTGAYPDVVTAVYQRACVALYGVKSQYASAALTFSAGDIGSDPATLVLTGLDDEWAGEVPIMVTVNGVVEYQGDS